MWIHVIGVSQLSRNMDIILSEIGPKAMSQSNCLFHVVADDITNGIEFHGLGLSLAAMCWSYSLSVLQC